MWHATLDGLEKKKDANDVYRKCETALREAQDDNQSLRARIREL